MTSKYSIICKKVLFTVKRANLISYEYIIKGLMVINTNIKRYQRLIIKR